MVERLESSTSSCHWSHVAVRDFVWENLISLNDLELGQRSGKICNENFALWKNVKRCWEACALPMCFWIHWECLRRGLRMRACPLQILQFTSNTMWNHMKLFEEETYETKKSRELSKFSTSWGYFASAFASPRCGSKSIWVWSSSDSSDWDFGCLVWTEGLTAVFLGVELLRCGELHSSPWNGENKKGKRQSWFLGRTPKNQESVLVKICFCHHWAWQPRKRLPVFCSRSPKRSRCLGQVVKCKWWVSWVISFVWDLKTTS